MESTANDRRGRIIGPVNITNHYNCLDEFAIATEARDGGVVGCEFRNILNQAHEWGWNGKLPKDERL